MTHRHDEFVPIEPPASHLLAVEQALSGMANSDWLEMKEAQHKGKDAVDTKFESGALFKQ